MQSTDLTSEQIEKVLAEVRTSMRHLGRLKSRMEKRGFHPKDTIFKTTVAAHDAVHQLSVKFTIWGVTRLNGSEQHDGERAVRPRPTEFSKGP